MTDSRLRRLQASHPYVLVFGVFAPALALVGVASLFVLGEPTLAQTIVMAAFWLFAVATFFSVARAGRAAGRSKERDAGST